MLDILINVFKMHLLNIYMYIIYIIYKNIYCGRNKQEIKHFRARRHWKIITFGVVTVTSHRLRVFYCFIELNGVLFKCRQNRYRFSQVHHTCEETSVPKEKNDQV